MTHDTPAVSEPTIRAATAATEDQADSTSDDSATSTSTSTSTSTPTPRPRRRTRGGRGGGRGPKPAPDAKSDAGSDPDSDAGPASAVDATAPSPSEAPQGDGGPVAKPARAPRPRTPATRRPRSGGTSETRAVRSERETAGPKTEPAESAESDVDAPAMSTTPRKRRRRGGRGRGKKPAQVSAEGAEAAVEGQPAEEAGSPAGEGGSTLKPRTARARLPAAAKDAAAVTDAEAPAPKARARRPAAQTVSPEAPAEPAAPAEDTGADAGTPAKGRRRRGGRGRGKSTSAQSLEGEESAEETRPTARPTARRAAASAPPKEESQISTRLRRARQTRQTRTSTRRRREPLPVVPRVTDKLMVITEHGERDQIAVLEGRDLVQHYVTRIGARSMVGNVYLGRVQNVLPGMEAAFIDVGRGRNAVLYAGEVNYSPEDLDGSPPRIEKVLKGGQSVLVQVTKDPIGGKGARLTAQISMPGRYLVLVPSSNVTGISRRLAEDERKRLKAIYKKIKPDPHGLIVRTAAEGASEEALAADLQRLLEEWTAIEKRAKKAKAPAILYEEPELTVRVVRDLFTDEEYRELVTDSPRVYEIVTDYLRQADPDVLSKVRLHESKLPAFEEFHIVEQIHKGLDRKVWLPSGGYIVIDRTEALTVIDVNTGKSVGKTNLEETVVNTNLEAAREVARQLRLRDIGGMIVIDMIDMLLEQNKKKVIETLRESLAQDKSRSQVFDISPLGLLEVTRKRVSGGLLESFSETCPTCEGRGVLLTYDVN